MKPRRADDLEKKRVDDARRLREWKAWHREQLDAALAGEHGVLIAALVKLLGRLDLRAAAALVEFMRREDWIAVPYDVRYIALHETHQAIMRLRERNGLPPLDDPVPFLDQADNAYRHIRQILLNAAPPGAHPGP